MLPIEIQLLVMIIVIGNYLAIGQPKWKRNSDGGYDQDCSNDMLCRIGGRIMMRLVCFAGTECRQTVVVLGEHCDEAMSRGCKPMLKRLLNPELYMLGYVDETFGNPQQESGRRTKREANIHADVDTKSQIKNRFSFGGGSIKSETEISGNHAGFLNGNVNTNSAKSGKDSGPSTNLGAKISVSGMGNVKGYLSKPENSWFGKWIHGGAAEVKGNTKVKVINNDLAIGDIKKGSGYYGEVKAKGVIEDKTLTVRIDGHRTVGIRRDGRLYASVDSKSTIKNKFFLGSGSIQTETHIIGDHAGYLNGNVNAKSGKDGGPSTNFGAKVLASGIGKIKGFFSKPVNSWFGKWGVGGEVEAKGIGSANVTTKNATRRGYYGEVTAKGVLGPDKKVLAVRLDGHRTDEGNNRIGVVGFRTGGDIIAQGGSNHIRKFWPKKRKGKTTWKLTGSSESQAGKGGGSYSPFF